VLVFEVLALVFAVEVVMPSLVFLKDAATSSSLTVLLLYIVSILDDVWWEEERPWVADVVVEVVGVVVEAVVVVVVGAVMPPLLCPTLALCCGLFALPSVNVAVVARRLLTARSVVFVVVLPLVSTLRPGGGDVADLSVDVVLVEAAFWLLLPLPLPRPFLFLSADGIVLLQKKTKPSNNQFVFDVEAKSFRRVGWWWWGGGGVGWWWGGGGILVVR
jgi:hypothetical protein